MKLGVLFSGGKDSVFSMYKAIQKKHSIACLISVQSENVESYMFHTPNIHMTVMQAEALGMPLILQSTRGEKEEELIDLKSVIELAKKKYAIEGIVTGAIESVYQATRIQKICDELDLWCFNPLWQVDQIDHLNELVEHGFKVMISAVMAEPFDKKWLGRALDKKAIQELEQLHKKYKINPAGEGGEFESLVLDGPLFKKKIEIISSKTHYAGGAGVFEIKEARLVGK